MQRLWRVGSHTRRNSRALLWPIPSLQARPPAAYVLTIRVVLSTKFPAERRFFIQDYEQMHAKTNCCDSGNREHVSVSEDNPQPDPAHCKSTYMGLRTWR